MWGLLVNNNEVSVKSGNGVGKSSGASIAALWFLNSFRPSIVITTAPTERQVKEILWREIRYWHSTAVYPLEGKPLTMKLELGPKHFAIGFTTSPESIQQMQGLHCENIMVIIDEANGYADELYEPIEGVLSGGNKRLLFQIGNPLVARGRFHKSFSDGITKTQTINCLNHPNVISGNNIIPGAVTKEWVEKQRRLWGEDSAFWMSRVLGEFPKTVADVIIELDWIEEAELAKVKESKHEEIFMGHDPAEYGNDEYVWYIGTRKRMIETLSRTHMEPAEAINVTKRFKTKYNIPDKNITVDGIGAGATMCSVLHQDKIMVNRFVASMSAYDSRTYEDRSTESWFNLKKILNPKNEDYAGYAFGEKVDRLKADLCTRTFVTSRHGKYMLIPKTIYRKKFKRSPGWGDAMALCYSPMCSSGLYDFILLPDIMGEF